ncbi:hypothetical protein [Streptomyces geranii]|uniref:hypothetical protein n=1 Tax=Streptomyces geranii TaxID=2058923 RepID=UPI00130070CF|nr:hypothetical protein [Streptomyces geranii]
MRVTTDAGRSPDGIGERSGHSCPTYGGGRENERFIIIDTVGDPVLIRLFGLRRTLKIAALFVGGVMIWGWVKG